MGWSKLDGITKGEMKYLLMIVLLCTVSQVRATFVSGNTLLEWCEAYINETSAAKGNNCAVYIEGISDIQSTYAGWGKMKKSFCTPESANISQLVRVVTKHMQEYPEDLHLSASSMVANALIKAFPCE